MIDYIKAPINAIRAYYALNSIQKGILRSKNFSGKRTPRKWLKFLSPVIEFLYQADLAQKFYKIFAISGFIICILLLVPIFIKYSPVWIILATLILFFGFVSILMHYALKSLRDFSENFDKFVFPFIEFLQQANPGKKLKMNLDLRGKTIDEREDHSRKPGTKNYRDTWFTGEMILPDRTLLKWEITDKIKEIKKENKNEMPTFKCRTKRFINIKRFKSNKILRSQRKMKFTYFLIDLNAKDRNLDMLVPKDEFIEQTEELFDFHRNMKSRSGTTGMQQKRH